MSNSSFPLRVLEILDSFSDFNLRSTFLSFLEMKDFPADFISGAVHTYYFLGYISSSDYRYMCDYVRANYKS